MELFRRLSRIDYVGYRDLDEGVGNKTVRQYRQIDCFEKIIMDLNERVYMLAVYLV